MSQPNSFSAGATSNEVTQPAIILSDSSPIKFVKNYVVISTILTDIFTAAAGNTLEFIEIWKTFAATGHDRIYSSAAVLDILFRDKELYETIYLSLNNKRVIAFRKKENRLNLIRWKGPSIPLQEACSNRYVTPALYSNLLQWTIPTEYKVPQYKDSENRTLNNVDDVRQFNFLKSHVLHFNPNTGQTKFIPFDVGAIELSALPANERRIDNVTKTLHDSIHKLLKISPDQKMFFLDILSATGARFPELPWKRCRAHVNDAIRKNMCLKKVGRDPLKGDIIQLQGDRRSSIRTRACVKKTANSFPAPLPTVNAEEASKSVTMSDIRRRFSKRQQFLDSLEEPDSDDLCNQPPILENATLQGLALTRRPSPLTTVILSPQLPPKRQQYRSTQYTGLMRNGLHPGNGNMATFQKFGPTHVPKTVKSKKKDRTLRAIEKGTRENKQYEHFRSYLAGQPRISVESAVRSRLVPKALMCRSYQHPFDTSSLEPFQKEFLQNYTLFYNQEHGTFEFTIHTSDRGEQKRKTPPMIPEIRVFAPKEEPAAKIYRPEPIHPVNTPSFDARQFLHPQLNLRTPTSGMGCLPQNIVDLSRLVFQAQQGQTHQFTSPLSPQHQQLPKTGFTIPELIAQPTSSENQLSKF